MSAHRKELDDTARARALKAARNGMAIDSIANLIGMAPKTFQTRRREEPEFEALLLAELAAWEEAQINIVNDLEAPLDEREFAMKALTRRRPDRYGDSKLRRVETHAEEEASEGGESLDPVTKAALEIVFEARKAGKL